MRRLGVGTAWCVKADRERAVLEEHDIWLSWRRWYEAERVGAGERGQGSSHDRPPARVARERTREKSGNDWQLLVGHGADRQIRPTRVGSAPVRRRHGCSGQYYRELPRRAHGSVQADVSPGRGHAPRMTRRPARRVEDDS